MQNSWISTSEYKAIVQIVAPVAASKCLINMMEHLGRLNRVK